MLTYMSLISCFVIFVTSQKISKESLKLKQKLTDLNLIESQENNFLEATSFKGYQQNNNGYNEEGGSAPEPYMFNFDIQDNENNKQFRKESSDGNAVKGSYGYVDANGLYRTVEYTADSESGFRAKVLTNEPGLMDAYYPDNNGRLQSIFPADVTLEVNEPPRNLQHSSSDQISNNHFSENYQNNNYQEKQSKRYQQQHLNEPDQYSSSNYNDNQHLTNLAFDSSNIKTQTKISPNNKANNNGVSDNSIKWTTNWSRSKKNPSFEHQSAYSDGHPIYVESNSKPKRVKRVKSLINKNLINLSNVDLESIKDRITFVKNQKFSNKTTIDQKNLGQQPKKFLLPNLQLEKPLQQFKSVKLYKPLHEIRQKFAQRHPIKFQAGFLSDEYDKELTM